MSANPLYRDVEGAPFRIGEWVLIVGSEDETFNPAYRGRVGIVKYLEYDCGYGQNYPFDPMIGIEFGKTTTAEFWAEELRRCPASRKESSHGHRTR